MNTTNTHTHRYSGTGDNAIISTGFIPSGPEADPNDPITVKIDPNSGSPAPQVGQQADQKMAREALTFFFSEEGYLFREILVDEICKGVDALSRDAGGCLCV